MFKFTTTLKSITHLFLAVLPCLSYGYTDPEPSTTETMTISYNKSIKSLDDSRTSDNIMVYPEQTVQAPNTVANIITQQAGVALNGQGGLFQSYNIRGFSRSRIKTEVDGIPIITDRRAGNAVSFIPSELISGVYIQKGPQSTLYGSDAMGGVISIATNAFNSSAVGITMQPQDNAQHIWARFNGESISASVIHRQADNGRSPSNEGTSSTELNTQYQQLAATLSAAFTWHDIDIFASSIISQGDDIGKSSSTFPQQRISSYPQDDHLLSQIEFSSPGQWKVKLYQHQQQWQTHIVRLDDNQATARSNITDYQSNTYGAYGSWLVDNTVLGLEWFGRHNIDISEREFSSGGELAWAKTVVDADEDTYAAYILHDWHVNKLTLATGARFDSINVSAQQQTKRDNFLSLSADISYTLSAQTFASIQIANAFRFPTVSELFFSGETPRGNTQGNMDLEPEQSLGLQISINHQLTPEFSTRFNAYHYDIDDYIERYTLDNIRYYRNSERVTIRGFELINDWRINPQWQTSLGLQWQQSRDINNNTVDDGLPKALKWALNWQHNAINIRQQLTVLLERSDVGPSESTQASELIWQITGDYQLSEDITLSMSILNITDNEYRASSDEDAAYQPERTINISGLWRF